MVKVQSDAEPTDDRPLGFRTNDVPDPYAEGPQSDAEPQETRNKQLPGPDSILHELGPRPDASADAVAWRETLEQQLSALVALARDTRSNKGGAAQWVHPIGALVSEFVKRIAVTRPDASAGLIEAAELAEECASECLEDRKAPLSAYALRDFAKLLRARAANRREK